MLYGRLRLLLREKDNSICCSIALSLLVGSQLLGISHCDTVYSVDQIFDPTKQATVCKIHQLYRFMGCSMRSRPWINIIIFTRLFCFMQQEEKKLSEEFHFQMIKNSSLFNLLCIWITVNRYLSIYIHAHVGRHNIELLFMLLTFCAISLPPYQQYNNIDFCCIISFFTAYHVQQVAYFLSLKCLNQFTYFFTEFALHSMNCLQFE